MQSPNFATVGKTGLWTALGSFVFVVFFFLIVVSVPLAAFLAASGLIPVGGFVVGALIALSFDHVEDED